MYRQRKRKKNSLYIIEKNYAIQKKTNFVEKQFFKYHSEQRFVFIGFKVYIRLEGMYQTGQKKHNRKKNYLISW